MESDKKLKANSQIRASIPGNEVEDDVLVRRGLGVSLEIRKDDTIPCEFPPKSDDECSNGRGLGNSLEIWKDSDPNNTQKRNDSSSKANQTILNEQEMDAQRSPLARSWEIHPKREGSQPKNSRNTTPKKRRVLDDEF